MNIKFVVCVATAVILSACGGGGNGSAEPPAASVPPALPAANAAPVANAGALQNVIRGTIVTLDGSGTDTDGDTLTYRWTLSAPPGSTATLSAASSPKPSFVADVSGAYTAALIVNDGKADSASVVVTVTAEVANVAPVALAGQAQNVLINALVALDGSASSDANGDLLSYAWTLNSRPGGSAAVLASANASKPSFTADVAGAYVASLIVSDGKASSTAATVTVNAAAANAAPVANAGPAQTVATGAQAQLSGSSSSDANGDKLTYLWTMTSRPVFSAAQLNGATSVTPAFTADQDGSYVVSLVVNDGMASSTAATVTVTATAKANPVPPGTGLIIQNGGTFQVLNESTMLASVSSSCGRSFNAIDQRPDGVIVAIDTSFMYEIDVFQPACINRGKTPEWINTLAVDSAGQYWGISLSQDAVKLSQRLYRLNPDGSAIDYKFLSGATSYITGMDFDQNGQLIGVATFAGGWGLVKIDTATGITTLLAPLAEHPDHDIDIDQMGVIRGMKSGQMLYFSGGSGIITKRTTVPNAGPASNFNPVVFVK